jgi:receptor expression-enhancing protein 5/6
MFLGDGFTTFVTTILLVAGGYSTYKSIDGSDSDKKHWLTFWMMYGVIQFAEFFLNYMLYWMPFYNELKLGLYVYLAFFDGATKVYELVGKQGFKKAEEGIAQLHEKGMQNEQYKMLSERIESITNKKTN